MAGQRDPHRAHRHGRGLVGQGHPGHRRRQPWRLLRAGHSARGLRVRAELPGGGAARHARPRGRLHRPGAHHAPHNPAMAELVPLFETSRDKALEDAAAKAKDSRRAPRRVNMRRRVRPCHWDIARRSDGHRRWAAAGAQVWSRTVADGPGQLPAVSACCTGTRDVRSASRRPVFEHQPVQPAARHDSSAARAAYDFASSSSTRALFAAE